MDRGLKEIGRTLSLGFNSKEKLRRTFTLSNNELSRYISKDVCANWKVLLLDGEENRTFHSTMTCETIIKCAADLTHHCGPLVHHTWLLRPTPAIILAEWLRQTQGFYLFANGELHFCPFCLPLPSVCSVCIDRVQHLPADQAEPGKAVVEGVPASHRVLALLGGGVGHVSSAIVHLSHEVEPLPVRCSDSGPIR